MSDRIDELVAGAIGREVTRISFDRQTRVLIDGGWELIFAGDTTWTSSHGEPVVFDAEEAAAVALELIGLRGGILTELRIGASTLLAVFGDRTLSTGADEMYENWEVVGPDGIMIVARPGGGEPAVWGRRAERLTDGT